MLGPFSGLGNAAQDALAVVMNMDDTSIDLFCCSIGGQGEPGSCAGIFCDIPNCGVGVVPITRPGDCCPSCPHPSGQQQPATSKPDLFLLFMQNLTVVLYHAPCYHVATQLLHQDDVVLSAHQAHHIHHAHNVHHIQVHTDVHMHCC